MSAPGADRLQRARERVGRAVPPWLRRWGRVALLAAGVAALSAAAVLLVRPAAVAGVVDPAALDRRLDGTAGVAVVAGGILLAAAVGVWKGATATGRGDRDPLRRSPTAPSAGEQAVGGDFDDLVEAAVDAGPAADESPRSAVRSRLRTTAVATLAAVDRESEAVARERVATGVWTDDDVVGAFLGDERAADAPLRWRLYAWLRPDRALERRVERTIAALETYREADP